MSLLISPTKCPDCGKIALYGSSCRDCGYVDPKYSKWVRKEIENLPEGLKACMVVYDPRITVYRRYTKIPFINSIIRWIDRIKKRESKPVE